MEQNLDHAQVAAVRNFLEELTAGYSYKPTDQEIVRILLANKTAGINIVNAPVFEMSSMAYHPSVIVENIHRLKQTDGYYFFMRGDPPERVWLETQNFLWKKELKSDKEPKSEPILVGVVAFGFKTNFSLYHSRKKTGWKMSVYQINREAFSPHWMLEDEWRFITIEPPTTWEPMLIQPQTIVPDFLDGMPGQHVQLPVQGQHVQMVVPGAFDVAGHVQMPGQEGQAVGAGVQDLEHLHDVNGDGEQIQMP